MNVARLYRVGIGIFSVLGLALGVVACGGTDTKPFTTTGSVIVTVYPDDADISLVALEVENADLSAQGLEPQQTGASLHYLKPPGDYKLTVSRDGYEPQTRSFTLQASELRYFSIFLEPGGDGPIPPDPDPDPGPNPDPDQDPVDLTLKGTVADWDAGRGGYLSFTNGLIIEETGEGSEIFFAEPIFPTTISEAGAFEVTLTEPAEEDLFFDVFCFTEVYTAYATLGGVSTEAYPDLGTVSGIVVQADLQDLTEPSVGDIVVGAVYFDRDVQAQCEDSGLRIAIDAKKGWNTVVQTFLGFDAGGFPEVELATKPAPPEAQWTFFTVEELFGPGQTVMDLRLTYR